MSETAIQLLMTDSRLEAESPEWVLLLERAATGDVSAFEQVMLRSERLVMNTARRMLGNVPDAEEASQEVFLRVYKYLHRFDRSKPFEPWIYRLTINVCNDIGSRRPRFSETVSTEMAGTGVNPLDSLQTDERRRLLQTALADLPAKQRAAIVLRDLQGLSTTEVADSLNVTEATVRSHLSAARLRLKRFIERRTGSRHEL